MRDFGPSDFPVPVEDIARSRSIAIARNPFKGTQSGFALRDGNIQVIGVNSLTSRKRQRFTIAHELGHLILHRGRLLESKLIVDHSIRVSWRDVTSGHGTDLEEIQANAFAAELLMPEALVRDKVHLLFHEGMDRDFLVSSLAKAFDVSVEAMGFRLVNLGIFAS
jgi:Zn-dependent peptidase ImmA (M78 family)